MQVTEKLSDGLRRELEIVLPAADLEKKLLEKLEEVKRTTRLKGFRPGKAPISHLRNLYGQSIMSEIVQNEVSSSTDKALKERNEKPAFRPEIKLTEDEKEIREILKGDKDLVYAIIYEILPEIELADFSRIKVEKPVAEIDEAEIDNELEEIAAGSVTYKAVEREARLKDRLTLDFVGKLDGEPFENGSAEDSFLVLGSGNFIEGFEDGLEGVKAGDEITVEGHFPKDYHASHLAGKTAQFEVKVKEVAEPNIPEIDDELAKTVGFENLEKLREAIRDGIREAHEESSRALLKKNVIDILDEKHDFELPPTLVETEFTDIWENFTNEMANRGKNFGDEGEDSEEEAREKYMKIARRRVKVGLILSHIAESNNIKVSSEELQNSLSRQISQFPGQEQQVIDFYQNNPAAVAALQAPILEDKAIDFLLELLQVEEKTLSMEEIRDAVKDDE
jgi:trigger factor